MQLSLSASRISGSRLARSTDSCPRSCVLSWQRLSEQSRSSFDVGQWKVLMDERSSHCYCHVCSIVNSRGEFTLCLCWTISPPFTTFLCAEKAMRKEGLDAKESRAPPRGAVKGPRVSLCPLGRSKSKHRSGKTQTFLILSTFVLVLFTVELQCLSPSLVGKSHCGC